VILFNHAHLIKIYIFFLFINDYSIRTCVYFLKEKSNVFNCFKKFKALVEKENIYSIESPKINKMGGFFSNEFNEFCEYHCIKGLLKMPRSP
jgi:5'-3' exoribonuclease 2